MNGWTGETGLVLASSTDQFVTGAASLKVTYPMFAASSGAIFSVSKPTAAFWPGTIVTMHVWVPAGTDGLVVQAFVQDDNYANFISGGDLGVGAVTTTRGAWTTLTFPVPNIFPGGLQVIGIQAYVPAGGVTFPGGDLYVDSITINGGVASCAVATGTGTYGFETDVTPWAVDGNPPDTAIAMSTTEFHGGANSLNVSFAALPAGTPAAPTSRRVRITGVGAAAGKAQAYCGQPITFNIWAPTGSDALQVQGYSQINNYGRFDAGPYATITRNGWSQFTYTLPVTGPGGIQEFGLQFNNTGAAFTGDVFIDDVSW